MVVGPGSIHPNEAHIRLWMSAEPIESLMKRIMDQYNRKTEGWTVLIDMKGNMLVLGPCTSV